jgi:hypothetical protein
VLDEVREHARPMSEVDCLVRAFWMLVGNAALIMSLIFGLLQVLAKTLVGGRARPSRSQSCQTRNRKEKE